MMTSALALQCLLLLFGDIRIADEIMADCMQEVSAELWEINNDIVEHTYKAEFKDAGLPTSPGGGGGGGVGGKQ